jgi:hypothetical protein
VSEQERIGKGLPQARAPLEEENQHMCYGPYGYGGYNPAADYDQYMAGQKSNEAQHTSQMRSRTSDGPFGFSHRKRFRLF